MKKEVSTLWTSALRGGKYRQARETLRQTTKTPKSSHSSFCCLGVLCDLYNKAHPSLQNRWIKTDGGGWEHFGRDGEPNETVRKWAGLTEGDISTLVSMNDDDEASFKIIADYIETKLTDSPDGKRKVRRWANQHGSGTIDVN